MTPAAWAVQYPDGRIDHELVGTQREVEWWCSTDEGRAAGRRSVALFLAPADAEAADILAEYPPSGFGRQWVEVGAWMHPGDVIALLDDWREVAQMVEPRSNLPEVAGSSPALASNAGRMHSCDDPLCAVCGNPWAPPVEAES